MPLENAIVFAAAGLIAVLVFIFTFREEISGLIDRTRQVGKDGIVASVNEDRRQQKIEKWREAVLNFDWDNGHIWQEPVWSEMRVYLPDDIVEEIESGIDVRPVLEIGRGKPSHKERLLEEIAKLEEEWADESGEAD